MAAEHLFYLELLLHMHFSSYVFVQKLPTNQITIMFTGEHKPRVKLILENYEKIEDRKPISIIFIRYN